MFSSTGINSIPVEIDAMSQQVIEPPTVQCPIFDHHLKVLNKNGFAFHL